MARKHLVDSGLRGVLCCFACALALSAEGLNFNFTYNAGLSTPPANLPDPTGAILMAAMEDAADVWEDIILDNWTINVELRWQVPVINGLPNNNFSGQMQQFQAHPGNVNNDPAEQNNRAVWTFIRMNPNRNWWIDATPTNNSEFDLSQTLYRDLSNGQQAAWFAGPVPNLLEVGYQGPANAGAQILIDDPNARDFLSVAVHELGHTVGIGGTNAAVNETTDGDYDIDSTFVGGANFDVFSEDNVGNAHINPSTTNGSPALMCVCGLGGARLLPSAIDVIAGATTANWTNIRLPRTDFLTGASWSTAGNWEGNRLPSTAVDAFVRTGGTVTLAGFGAAGNLLVDEGSTVSTQTNTLFVQNQTDVGGTSGSNSQITINTDGELDSDLLNINDDGTVVLVGASSLLQAERVNIVAGGELRGQGTVDLNDNLFGLLTSNGLIRATGGGELVITSQNGLGLDLAGGQIQAIDGNIRFDTGMSAGMSADLTIGAGRQVAFNFGGSVAAGGLLLFNGTSVSPATSTGSILFIENNGVVRADGVGVINNSLVLLASSYVETQPGSPNSEIRLNGATSFQGGRILGDGIVRQNGAATIQQNTEIDINTYDMDGQAGNTLFTVTAGRTLDIDSPNIDTGGVNDFDGTLQVNSGTVDIAAAWRLDGTLNLATTSSATPLLTGAGGVTVANNGEINITGAGDIATALSVDNGTVFVDGVAEFSGPTILGNNASVEINDAADSLHLLGQTTLIGPSIVGSGRIVFDGSINVAFFNTSIGAAETDLDGLQGNTAITINQGLTFSIASITLEPTANDGFDGVITNRGTFSVVSGWRLDGDLDMEQIGGTIPSLAGLGTFRIHTTGTFSTDGSSIINAPLQVAGAMLIDNGVTQVNNTASFESTANVVVEAGAELELNGITSFGGGSYIGQGLIQFNNTTTINSSTTIATARVDLDGAAENTHTILNNVPLVLGVDGVDATNNLFSGTIDVSGAAARLEVNLSNPLSAWRVTSAGVVNFSTASAGAVTMLDGSDVAVDGQINATGRVRLGANVGLIGTLQTHTSTTDVHFGSGGQNLIFNTATVAGAGDITIENGTRMHLEGGSNVGVDVENAGRLEVGFLGTEVGIDFTEAGSADIGGSFSQTGTGLFGVEVGGLLPASEHDQLDITGVARLSGTLEVELIDGFLPEIGDEVIVMLAGSVINTFDAVTAFDGGGMFGVEVAVLYSATDVTVRFDDLFLLGDYNRNGVVEAGDYVVWRKTLGEMGMDLLADGNGNDEIDPGDFDVWRAHFGNVFGSGAALNSTTTLPPAVPEPASVMLFLSSAVVGVWRRLRGAPKVPSTR